MQHLGESGESGGRSQGNICSTADPFLALKDLESALTEFESRFTKRLALMLTVQTVVLVTVFVTAVKLGRVNTNA